MSISRKLFVTASAFGLAAVALGAFGAHSLRETISADMFSVFDIGVRYQMYHTFALFIAAWFFQSRQGRKFLLAAWFFIAGVVLFSGSLYLLAVTGIRALGFVTPLGGLLLLAGWAMMAMGFLEEKSE